jgi:putative lipoic acid-binding regulatory protein
MNDQVEVSGLTFPCQYPIKVFGQTQDSLKEDIKNIVAGIVGDIDNEAVSTRESKDNKYTAVTVTIEAQSREQVDQIYEALGKSDLVLLAL